MNLIHNKKIARAAFLFMSACIIHAPLWAQQAPEKAQVPETKRNIRWGKADSSGLQIGVWQNEKGLDIFCLIRNVGAKKVRFSDLTLEFPQKEEVRVLARPVGKDADWTELGGSGFYISLARGLGPTEKNRITLLPGAEYLTRRNYSGSITKWPADYTQSSRWISPYDYIWPAQWKGAVEFKIEQELPNFDANAKDLWAGTLASGVLQADVDEIRRRQLQVFELQLAFQEESDAQSQTTSNFSKTFSERMRVAIEALKAAQKESAAESAAP